jgi:hypothetical protein
MREMIDPAHENERLEAAAFAIAELPDAMDDLINGRCEPRH